MVDRTVVAALADHVVPLDDEDPVRTDALPAVGDAAVVGLGEASHGARALFHLKRRVVRGLVADAGVRTLALEADVAGATALDAYVRHGTGDPETALAGLQVWPWKARELAGLLRWLRSFNEERSPPDRVRVVGVSPNDAPGAAERVRSFLDGAGADPPVDAVERLSAVAADGLPDDPEAVDAVEAAAERLGDHLDEHRPTRAADGPPRREHARRCCRALALAADWQRTRSAHEGPHAAGMAHRDRIMAEEVGRALDDDPGDGVVVWAHDSHVQRGTFDEGDRWSDVAAMGEHLDRRLGDRYRPLGSAVGGGEVRALERGSDGGPRTFALQDAPADSAAAHLAAVDADPYVLDLRTAASSPPLAGFFEREGRVRSVGSVYDPDAGWHHRETDLPASFDALLHAGTTAPTRLLDGA